MDNKDNKANELPELISMEEAMEYFHIASKTTMRKLLTCGSFPYIKIGRRVYIYKKELIQWMKNFKGSHIQL